MKWIPLAEVKKFDSTSIVRFIHTKKVLHEHNHFIEKHPDRINTLEYLDESPSDVSGLREGLENILTISKGGNIGMPSMLKDFQKIVQICEEALAQYSALTAPAGKIEGSISEGEEEYLLDISRFASNNKYKSPTLKGETASFVADIPKVIEYIKSKYHITRKQ